MATFKELDGSDIISTSTNLTQLVDVIGADVSGSGGTVKSYATFVTGGVGPGVTSSLFKTVYDQDYSLASSNAMFDVTIGINKSSAYYVTTSTDFAGKDLFSSQSIMMREKSNIYRQFAQLCLGDADTQFVAPLGSTSTSDTIDVPLFLSFKRLFVRDGVKRESVALRVFSTASIDITETDPVSVTLGPNLPNLFRRTTSGSNIITDVGSSSARETTAGGEAGNLYFTSNTSNAVGVMFYDLGTAVLDVEKIISASQHVSGTISGMSDITTFGLTAGKTVIGGVDGHTAGTVGNPRAKFVPDLITSASIDDIANHFLTVRLCGDPTTNTATSAMTFQNITNINSTIFFCRADANSFNYSSNPTYTDSNGLTAMSATDETAKPFTFITTVGLYNASNDLLAVAKLSRPILKSFENEVGIKVRIDF